MIRLLLIYVCTLPSQYSDNLCVEINSLSKVQNMPVPFNECGDTIIWEVVEKGLDIVPCLITGLCDTTVTIANVPYLGLKYRVGDICNFILEEIIKDLPTLDIIYELNDSIDKTQGYFAYYSYTRSSYNNMLEYQSKVNEWYLENKENLYFHKDDNFEYCPPIILREGEANTIRLKHPLGGYYKIGDNRANIPNAEK